MCTFVSLPVVIRSLSVCPSDHHVVYLKYRPFLFFKKEKRHCTFKRSLWATSLLWKAWCPYHIHSLKYELSVLSLIFQERNLFLNESKKQIPMGLSQGLKPRSVWLPRPMIVPLPSANKNFLILYTGIVLKRTSVQIIGLGLRMAQVNSYKHVLGYHYIQRKRWADLGHELIKSNWSLLMRGYHSKINSKWNDP